MLKKKYLIPSLRYHGNPNVEQSSTVHKNNLDIWYLLLAKVYEYCL